MNEPTREVFGNVIPAMRVLFYALIFGSIALLVFQVWKRSRLWIIGQKGEIERNPRIILQRLLTHVLAQKRTARRNLGGILHVFLFSGFVVLTIGTTLLAIADYGPVHFHRGNYYLLYELTMDLFGVALCIGCMLAIYRRAFVRHPSLGHRFSDYLLLSLLLLLGISGFVLEALRLKYTAVTPEIGRWSTVGWAMNVSIFRSTSLQTAQTLHLLIWWLHAIMVAALFAIIPQTRLMHIITGPLNIALRPSRHPGSLLPIDIEEVEKTGRIGNSEISHFTQQQLLSVDSCMSCGRCERACPAFASGKPLSPKSIVLNLKAQMESPGAMPLQGDRISAETLWSCTMCQACVYECPTLIGHVDLILDMRRHLVGEGSISGPPAKSMRNIGTQFNPYGRPHSERFAWADGLDVPTVEANPAFEYLLWVGCSASYDPRAQKVARATVELFKEANVNFAVLGPHERCTGDSARRLGDEFLFQEMVKTNIETLAEFKVKKIVTPCPHCMNSFRHEYPQFGAKYEVVHHSELLADLVENGKLPRQESNEKVTLHDPCYLARVNGQTESTRSILNGEQTEMPRHGKQTFCCGAGGGRMWFEEAPDQRVSRLRAAEAIATGANVVATACPFCLNMMTDGIASTTGGENIKVMDVAEILINGRQPKPTEHQKQ